MLPAKYDIKDLYRGDTYRRTFRLRFVNADDTLGDYADLTGCEPLAQIRTAVRAPEILETFDVTILDQTETPGGVQIELTPEQTATLPDTGRWDLQLTHPNGDVRTYLAGTVKAAGQVSE